MWGAARLGAVSVPVNTLLGAEDYAFLLNDSRARVAVVTPEVAPRLAAIRSRCPWLRTVLVSEGRESGALDWDDALARAKPLVEPARTAPDDVVYWGYTSGSTGRPKAAVHSHADFVAAADLVGVGLFGLGADDLVFSASKMFFAFGLGNSLYFPARVGAAAVLVPERITAERAFETIGAERPTVFFTVPTLWARMLEVPDAEHRWDLDSQPADLLRITHVGDHALVLAIELVQAVVVAAGCGVAPIRDGHVAGTSSADCPKSSWPAWPVAFRRAMKLCISWPDSTVVRTEVT